MGTFRPLRTRSDALDLSLLGGIVAGVAFYAGRLSGSAGAAPSLIRFFQVSPDRTYTAVLPQDKALLLLADPSTGGSGEVSVVGGTLGPLWDLLFVVGLLMVVAGPLLWWVREGDTDKS